MVLRSKASIAKYLLRLFLHLLHDTSDALIVLTLKKIAPLLVQEYIGKEAKTLLKKAYEKDKADKGKSISLLCLEILQRIFQLETSSISQLCEHIVPFIPLAATNTILAITAVIRWIRSALLEAIRDDQGKEALLLVAMLGNLVKINSRNFF